jgi:hypothetical protein
MDEARHVEALTRLYRALGTDPLGLRDLPELLVYHHRIRQGDRADWVWGILFSDVIAKHFYRAFGLAQADPLLGSLARRILQDESRHLAFAEHYLRRNVARMEPARRRALLGMRDDLFRLLLQMTERVRADAAVLDIDADVYLGHVWRDVEAFASRIGLSGDGPPSAPPVAPTSAEGNAARGGTATAQRPDAPAQSVAQGDVRTDAAAERATTGRGRTLPECFGCLLTLLCAQRVGAVPA